MPSPISTGSGQMMLAMGLVLVCAGIIAIVTYYAEGGP